MSGQPTNPLFSAAVLKARFARLGKLGDPGFRFVFRGTLEDLGVSEQEVDRYIESHRDEIDRALDGG